MNSVGWQWRGAPPAVRQEEDELHGARAVVGVHARHLRAGARAQVREKTRARDARDTRMTGPSARPRACTPPSTATGVSKGSTRSSSGCTPSLKLRWRETARQQRRRLVSTFRAACEASKARAHALRAHRTSRAVISLQYTGPAWRATSPRVRACARVRVSARGTHAQQAVNACNFSGTRHAPRAARARGAPASCRRGPGSGRCARA
jgi:hypothetical protein